MNNRATKSVLATLATLSIVTGAASCSLAKAEPQNTVTAKKGDITLTVASDGNLALINDRKLTFQTSGIIKEVNVREGDRVTSGQVLAKLDTGSLEITINNAALGVKNAEIDLEVANDNYQKITYPYTFSTIAFSIPDSLNSINIAQRNIDEIQQKIAGGVNPDDLAVLNQQLRDATDNLTKAREKLGLGTGPGPLYHREAPDLQLLAAKGRPA